MSLTPENPDEEQQKEKKAQQYRQLEEMAKRARQEQIEARLRKILSDNRTKKDKSKDEPSSQGEEAQKKPREKGRFKKGLLRKVSNLLMGERIKEYAPSSEGTQQSPNIDIDYATIAIETEFHLRSLEVLVNLDKIKEKERQGSIETHINQATQISITLLRLRNELKQRVNTKQTPSSDKQTIEIINELVEIYLESARAAIDKLDSDQKKSDNQPQEKNEKYNEIVEKIERAKDSTEEDTSAEDSKQQTSGNILDEAQQKLNELLLPEQKPRKESAQPESQQERAKRVANYRQIKILEQRQKELEEQDEDKHQSEIKAIQRQIDQLMLDQIVSAQSIEITLEDQDTEQQTLLDIALDSDQIGEILEVDSLPKSEKARFEELRRLLTEVTKESDIMDLLRDPKRLKELLLSDQQPEEQGSTKVDPEQVRKILELLAHPEVFARIEYENAKINTSERQEEDELESTAKTIEKFIELEGWRRTGNIDERIQTATDEIYSRLMMQTTTNVSLTDIGLILEYYNLGQLEVDANNGEASITFNTETDFDDNQKELIHNLVEQALKFKRQHDRAIQILDQMYEAKKPGEPKDRGEEEDKPTFEEFLKQIDIGFGELQTESEDQTTQQEFSAFQELYKQGFIDIVASPTGFSIVINTTYIPEDENHPFRQLLKALGQEQRQKAILDTGLGVTIRDDSQILKGLKEYLNKYTSNEDQATPSLNIIILPQIDLNQDAFTRLQMHETQDYMMSHELKLEQESNQDQSEARILREFISKTIDGSLGTGQNFTEQMGQYFQLYGMTQNAHVKFAQGLFHLFQTTQEAIKSLTIDVPQNTDFPILTENIMHTAARTKVAGVVKRLIRENPDTSFKNLIDTINEQLRIEFGLETNTKSTQELSGEDLEKLFNHDHTDQNDTNILAQNFMFSMSDRSPLVPIGSESSPISTAVREAMAHDEQFGGNPVPKYYGPNGARNTIWPYANDTNYIRMTQLIPFLNRLPKPVKSLLDTFPIPIAGLGTYADRQARGSLFARHPDPYVRNLARKTGFVDLLGSGPTKRFKQFSPALANKMKEVFPGWIRANKIEEAREITPFSMQLKISDILYGHFPNWLFQIGREDAKIPGSEMLRHVAQLPSLEFVYEQGKGYNISFDINGLRNITDIRDITSWDKFLHSAVKGFAIRGVKASHQDILEGKVGKGYFDYTFDYSKAPHGQYDGIVESFIKGMILDKGASEAQIKVAKFYKKHARRSDLPKHIAKLISWEQQLGSEFRKYLQKRDGLLALQTLAQESEYFKNQGEDYSFFELTELIFHGDSIPDRDAWLRNETNRTIKLKYRKNGRIHTISILPGERLVDPDGNLIFKSVKLKKNARGGYELDKHGMLAVSDDPTSKAFWRRLVGDYENPHLRFIRLNSKKARKYAVRLFGQDPDKGFADPDNILLRTDGIKNMIKDLWIAQVVDSIEKGLPPDRRYAMENIEAGVSVIKFKDGLFEEIDGKRSSQDKPTGEFKTELIRRIENLQTILGASQVSDAYIDKLKDEINQDDFTRQKASKLIEDILAITRGRRDKRIDGLFEDFMNFSDDPSWSNPYRQELPAIQARNPNEVRFIKSLLEEGTAINIDRYEAGQNALYQWQIAYLKLRQFERIAFAATMHYKGLSRRITRLTNLFMGISFVILATSVSGMAVNAFVLSFLTRIFGKPWAVEQEKTWFARRLRALQKTKEVQAMDALFQSAIEKKVPNPYELARMRVQLEELIFFLEDVATAKPDDDWYPKNDTVINQSARLFGKAKQALAA